MFLYNKCIKKTFFSKFKIELSKILEMIVFRIHGMSLKNISLVTNASRQCVARLFRKYTTCWQKITMMIKMALLERALS
ncbi:hypothetical protein H312_02275 [Anncaliia algerae PRA339]|uniref:Uncharacterized protein n=1 Tax=Anncaliia algerae PRA339 TaxID=1288291 RepID=A0A059EZL4_9MICR|nr:hypothetical protein H312_02275 [Anncaliia algerae PRA339]